MASFTTRMLGAAMLDSRVYEDVEADTRSTGQALTVVVLASVGDGVGWIGVGPGGASAMLVLTAVAVAGWVAWAALTYLIGTHLLPEPQTRADIGQLMRTLGFAQAPGVLRVLGVIPGLAPITTAVVAFWTLATTVVAVRQALDYSSTGRAIAVCVTGWVVAVVMFLVIGLVFAPAVS